MPVPNIKAAKLSEMMDTSPKTPLVQEEVASSTTVRSEDMMTARFFLPRTLPFS